MKTNIVDRELFRVGQVSLRKENYIQNTSKDYIGSLIPIQKLQAMRYCSLNVKCKRHDFVSLIKLLFIFIIIIISNITM